MLAKAITRLFLSFDRKVPSSRFVASFFLLLQRKSDHILTWIVLPKLCTLPRPFRKNSTKSCKRNGKEQHEKQRKNEPMHHSIWNALAKANMISNVKCIYSTKAWTRIFQLNSNNVSVRYLRKKIDGMRRFIAQQRKQKHSNSLAVYWFVETFSTFHRWISIQQNQNRHTTTLTSIHLKWTTQIYLKIQ